MDALFTTGGQQKQLQPGQSLTWTPRNKLLKVTPIVRSGGADDSEIYRYDAGSLRILKVSSQKTGGSMQTQRVQYLRVWSCARQKPAIRKRRVCR